MQNTYSHITLDDTIEMDGNFYGVHYWNSDKVEGHINPFKIYIHRDQVKVEAEKRGILNTYVSYYSNDSEEPKPITFEEFEEDTDYREQFDKLVLSLLMEQFSVKQVEEGKKVKVMLDQYKKEVQELNDKLVASRIREQVQLNEIERLTAFSVSNTKQFVITPTYAKVKQA